MIKFKVDNRSMERGLDSLARRQLPFALAQTLNAIGRAAIPAERAAMSAELDRPRPFTTQQGLRLAAARKNELTAMVLIPPIQAHYLAPEILGGLQALNRNRAVLRPIDQATDQYGNLPRSLLARLRGRRDVFIGTVRGVDGVWQRLPARAGVAAGPRLRLLICFAAPVTVRTRYRFGEATLATARRMAPGELRRQLALALRSARP